jgi:sugar porter (SP) family MFS transporter
LVVGRAFLGLGTGGLIATISVWQSEVSKSENRGAHVTGFGLFCSSGHAVALFLAFGMSYVEPTSSSVSWRLVLSGSLLFSILTCVFIFTLPESPRWLGKVGRWEEARDTLACLYDVEPTSEKVQQLLTDIKVSIELSGEGRLGSMLKMDRQRTLHRVVLAVMLQMFLQMNGVNSIVYYTPTIFHQELGFSSTVSRILAACAQLAYVCGSLVCLWTVDRFGRRVLMLISSSLMCACFACLAGTASDPNNKAALKSSAFFIFFYLFSYVLGFLGIPFLYASEVAPVQLRAAICGVSTAASWLFNFLVAEITPTAFTNLGHYYFIVYAGINAVCIPTIYFFYPETAQRSLEEIDEIFISSNSIFDTVRIAKNLPHGRLATLIGDDLKTETTDRVETVEEVNDDAKRA